MELPSWAPTVKQVAGRIMARTRIANGSLAGTFTTETTPTSNQVEEVIEEAVGFLLPRLGPVAQSQEFQARALAALRCAYMIEEAYFPEQVESYTSPLKELRLEYKEELDNWDKAARGEEPNDQARMTTLPVGTLFPGYATGTYHHLFEKDEIELILLGVIL